MNIRKRRAAWWQLWLLFPVLGILAVLDVRTPLSRVAHIALEIGIVLIIFGVVWVRMRADQVAMVREVSDRLFLSEIDEPAGVLLEPGAIAGKNGNGHQSERILVTAPDREPVYGHPKETR